MCIGLKLCTRKRHFIYKLSTKIAASLQLSILRIALTTEFQIVYIQPCNPQQNAYVERFNQTVRYD